MNQKKKLLILISAFVLLLAGAYVLYDRLGQSAAPEQLAVQSEAQAAQDDAPPNQDGGAAPETKETPEEPEKIPAPDFTVYDADGNAVHLSDFVGTPVVLNFWASWCGPCKSEMPDFNETFEALDGAVQFLMINLTDGSRETVETASAFVEAQGYTFPVVYDTESDAALTYGVYSIPTTFFIDAEGCAVAQATGAIDAETLQRGLDLILP